MNLLLVDDEMLALEALKTVVTNVLPNETINTFNKASQAIDFAKSNKIDIALLDIDMRLMNGLEMAKALQELYPYINIIFVTGYAEYALDAFNLYASAYLTKPVSEDDVRSAFDCLRYPIVEKRVRFHCFGNFEAYCDNTPIKFSLNKTKELLAYLVDRDGAECRRNEIISILFEDNQNIEYYKKLRKDLIETLTRLGIENILNISRGGISINKDVVDCDYYKYLAGDEKLYIKEYMTQYSFAEGKVNSL